jgi:hypothetical protein
MLTDRTTLLSSDSAENSIMQTISIAVSAILIAAGLVTAPGLINNARDNNARTDLANIAYAQEGAMGTVGHYFENILEDQEDSLYNFAASEANEIGDSKGAGAKYTLSGQVTNHEARVCSDPDFFLLKDRSSSGNWFYRGSANAVTSKFLSDITVPDNVLEKCPTIRDGFEEDPNSDPNPTTPVPGTNIPSNISAGSGILDTDVNSLIDSSRGFAISGYGVVDNSASVAKLGSSEPWYPNLGEDIELSYIDDSTNELVPFYSEPDNYQGSSQFGSKKDGEIYYNSSTKRIFGHFYDENANPDAKTVNGFKEMSENGGSMTFDDGDEALTLTVVWLPSTGDNPVTYPTYPPIDGGNGDNGGTNPDPQPDPDPEPQQPDPVYANKWTNDWDESGNAQRVDTSSNGMTVITANESLFTGNVETQVNLSTDGGETFNPMTQPGGYMFTADGVKIADDGSFFVWGNGDIWKSTDQGVTWKSITPESTDYNSDGWALGFANTDIASDGKRIAFSDYNGYVGISTDGGENWNVKQKGDVLVYGYVRWAGERLFLGTHEGPLQYTTDGGNTMTTISEVTPTGAHSLDVSDDGSTLITSSYFANKVWLSHDNGNTWTTDLGNLPSATDIREKSEISDNGQKIIVGDANYSLYLSEDGGQTWEQQIGVSAGFWKDLSGSDNFERIYASGNRYYTALYRHIDGETECFYYCGTNDGGGGAS